MALTPSTMLALGTKAPDFLLPDVVTNRQVALRDVAGEKGFLIMFICRHCPYVVHIQRALIDLGRDYASSGLGIAAISSNDADNYPEDAPGKLREMARELGLQFPYLYDESQEVAKAYQAACTPDFFLFNARAELVYRGQLDDSRPGNDLPVTGRDLRAAMDAVIQGREVSQNQKPSMGCNIKWKTAE